MSYLGRFQGVPQAMPALLSFQQQSSETCQLPFLWTNYLHQAMSCSVSGGPLHLAMTRETLHHRVMGSNQPKNSTNSTVNTEKTSLYMTFHKESIKLQLKSQVF
jgi:hypothetical protein